MDMDKLRVPPVEIPRAVTEQAQRMGRTLQEKLPEAGEPNVGSYERWVSLLGGGALVVFGLTRRPQFGLGLAALGAALIYRGVTRHDPIFKALDIDRSGGDTFKGIKVEKAVTINRSPEELFSFWRNFTNLPQFMNHLESVTTTDEWRSHWVAKAPLGRTVEWDAQIVHERPNEFISWESMPNADVPNRGQVRFVPAPGGRGTEVHVSLEYNPPAGQLGALVAKMFGEEPTSQVTEDLRRFKRMMETGEIATIEGQTSGREKEA